MGEGWLQSQELSPRKRPVRPSSKIYDHQGLAFEEQNPETDCPSHLGPLGSWPGGPPLPHTETALPGRPGVSPTG